MSDTEVVRSICRGCGHGGCGVLIHLKDGEIVTLRGDREHPISKGYICSKAFASLELVRHPARLRRPLKRAGGRGEGRWEVISWSDALEGIAEELKRIIRESGPEAIALTHGTGRDTGHFFYRFANAIGTPNVVSSAHICYVPRLALTSILGLDGMPICDYDSNPNCVLAWGSNTPVSHADEYVGINLELALRRGAKLIVVDPRRTRLASRAELWLQPRPGTDLALAYGMINVIVEEGLYDEGFVEGYSTGFDELVEHVNRYSPEKVEGVTWVPASKLREAARIYAETKPACLQWGVGVEHNVNCVGTDLALLYLVALTGNLDTAGGNVLFPPPPIVSYSSFKLDHLLPWEQRVKRLGGEQYKLLSMVGRCPPYMVWRAVLKGEPYPIRALIAAGTNPLASRENSSKVYEALKRIEFLVVLDFFLTPTAELADYVLPVASWLEQDGVADYWKHHGYVFPRRKVIDTPECWSDARVSSELAGRMGLREHFWEDADEVLEEILKPAGLTWSEFKDMRYLRGPVEYWKYRRTGFTTRSAKFEFYPQALKQWGYNTLPDFREPAESPVSTPQLAEKYPYILISGGRVFEYFASEGRNLPSLRRAHPDPLVEIHPETASKHGIKEGDWVFIETRRGRIRQRARLTEGVHPKVVHVEHGWWLPEVETPDHGWREHNANILTDDEPPLDPIMGATCLRGLLCNIGKA